MVLVVGDDCGLRGFVGFWLILLRASWCVGEYSFVG